jgi:hypothetical protein
LKDGKIDFIFEGLKNYIQEDIEQTLSKVLQDVKYFNDTRAAIFAATLHDDNEDQDRIDHEIFIKLISKDIQRVDATAEVLGDYMKKDENIQKLQEVIELVRKTFMDIFAEIMLLGESDISSAFENLYQI